MASFAWNLEALKSKGAVEQALANKLEQVEAAKVAMEKAAPLGALAAADDIWDGRPARPDGKPIATLATSWMMAVRHGCVQPTSMSYYCCNNGSRLFYATSMLLCVGIAIGSFAQTKLYQPEIMDWFGWFCWAIVAFCELLFIVARIVGRCWQWRESRHYTSSIHECLQSLIRRTPFGEGWIAVSVTVLNVVFSVLFMFGLLVIQVQMLIDPDFDDDLAFVPFAYRDTWTAMWTLAYVFILFSLSWSVLLDPSRFGDLREVNWLVVETDAWRVLLLGIVMPIVGFGFAMYANVCCSGNFYYRD